MKEMMKGMVESAEGSLKSSKPQVMTEKAAKESCQRCGRRPCQRKAENTDESCDTVERMIRTRESPQHRQEKDERAKLAAREKKEKTNKKWKRKEKKKAPENELSRASQKLPGKNRSSGRAVCFRWWRFGDAVNAGYCVAKECKYDHFIDETGYVAKAQVKVQAKVPVKALAKAQAPCRVAVRR